MNIIEHKFTIQDENNDINFIAIRLRPLEQFNLIMKLIKIIAQGNINYTPQVEQILHNVFQTGKIIAQPDNNLEVNTFNLVLDAIKGALANLTDENRDWLINELIKNLKIEKNTITQTVTIDVLNNTFSSYKPFFKLIFELVKLNLGFLQQEKK